jgi:putative spermidine/putrescine transport system ATP-binding protein
VAEPDRRGTSVVFRNATKHYGNTVALADFDLELRPGEFVTLLGPSGSGKTTALNILAGFTNLTIGDVLIDGRSVVSLPPERRNIGMVFQHFSLFPHMTVFDNVAFPLRLRRVPRDQVRTRVMDALAMVRLSELAGRMPNALSGGERQRVAVARAVVFRPPVLLMDEPLSALDLKLRGALQLELRQVHSEVGCTILFVTHDQNEALTLSDRIAVMRSGRVVQIDTPDTMYDRPRTRFVADFIGHTNIFELTAAGERRARIVDLGVEIALAEALRAPVLSLRPEKLRRIENGDGADHLIAFDATIDEPLFLGDTVHYTVRLGHGRTLHFREHRGSERTLLRRGDAVRLGFRPEDAIPVAADD